MMYFFKLGRHLQRMEEVGWTYLQKCKEEKGGDSCELRRLVYMKCSKQYN